MFSSPSTGGSGVKPADIEGHLLIVEPQEVIIEMQTSMGTADAVRCTVHDVTDGETHLDTLFFSRALVSSLRNRIGERVLGVMGKGTAKPGQSAPWILEDKTSDVDSVAAATEYINNATAKTLTAPAASGSGDVDAKKAALSGLAQ